MPRLLFFLLCLAAPLPSQMLKIGAVEFYGLDRVAPERLMSALNIQPGDRLPASKAVLEQRLETLEGVVAARVEGVCCVEDRITLFVGIQEAGAPVFEVREPPTGEELLPDVVVDAYERFLDSFSRAVRESNYQEDLTRGHPLALDPATRLAQLRFIGLAELHLDTLRTVLKNSVDPEQRAIAACVLGYAPDKKAVIEDLQIAMRDADEGVRGNAARSLHAIAVMGQVNADAGIRVEPTWFVEMLNSLAWRERVDAAKYLLSFTDSRDERILRQIRNRAARSVLEMAAWNSLEYALPAYLLAGRAAGIPEPQLQDAWRGGSRDAMLERIRRLLRK